MVTRELRDGRPPPNNVVTDRIGIASTCRKRSRRRRIGLSTQVSPHRRETRGHLHRLAYTGRLAVSIPSHWTRPCPRTRREYRRRSKPGGLCSRARVRHVPSPSDPRRVAPAGRVPERRARCHDRSLNHVGAEVLIRSKNLDRIASVCGMRTREIGVGLRRRTTWSERPAVREAVMLA